jgi:hypothetical protein
VPTNSLCLQEGWAGKGAKEVQIPGLKWQDIGSKPPKKGAEIQNDDLAEALRKKQIIFTAADLAQLNVSNLSFDSYILVDSLYFKPVVQKGVKGFNKLQKKISLKHSKIWEVPRLYPPTLMLR